MCASSSKSSTRQSAPTVCAREAVEVAAYYLWLKRERDGTRGTAAGDWSKAERQLGICVNT